MTSFVLNITFDCADPPALARFWGQVTGWPVIEEPRPGHEESAVVPPGEGRPPNDADSARGSVPEAAVGAEHRSASSGPG
jgi:Glyoxalase-like domain